jgi:chemotaxis protein histidine kinase CheA
LVDQFVRDRRAFRSFWGEASRLVATILDANQPPPELLRRYVHTLKGNARFFGLNRVSSSCHEIESAMAERGEFNIREIDDSGTPSASSAFRILLRPSRPKSPERRSFSV